ncbi:hypothetical protein GQ600_26746 [Phytophthora cactorum]|nr:hypothetical protein GQ600_26746 [Phytophthora cactorum]
MWRAMTVFCRSNPTWWLEASYLFKKARRSPPSMNSRATHKSESESQATPIKDTIWGDLGFGQERVDVLKTGACGRWQHFNCHSSLVEDALYTSPNAPRLRSFFTLILSRGIRLAVMISSCHSPRCPLIPRPMILYRAISGWSFW